MVMRNIALAAFAALLVSAAIPAQAANTPQATPAYASFIVAGRLESSRDNYAASEAAYRQALAIEQKTLGPNSVVVGETLAELALQVSNQQRFDEAANLFQRATPIIEASSSDAARARLDSYRALDAANQRNYSDALKYARQATGARRAELANAAGGVNAASTNGIAASADRGELAHSLRIEAEMALRLGDLASARASGEEALWIISEQPGLPLWWRPDVISLMGEINEHDSRVVVAERDFRDARDLDSKLFGDTGPTAIADLRLGRFYSDQQLYPASVDAYRKGFAILAKDADARSQVIPDQIVPFITAAAAAGGDGANAEIFRASQLVNSSVADQSIVRVAAREAAATPALADLVRQAQAAAQARDTARVLLAAEYAKDDADRSTAREDQMDANLRAASAHADDLAAQVTQSFPQYAQLADPAPADLSAVQAQLKPGEAMISFVIGLDGSYALLVTHDGMTIAPLKATEGTLTADIADLRRAFSPTLGKLPEFSLKTSYGLYTDLMAPLEAKLSGVDHLIVVPGAALSDLPFAMLVTAPPQGTNYAQAAWLVRRMAVSQVPSARAFLSLRQEPRVALARPFLGLGDPTFHGAGGAAGAKALGALADYCQEDGGVSPDLLRALPPLPDTAREVQAVSARLGGGTVLLGPQATEANLRAQPLDQYAVLYFATHGVLPGQLHCQSEPGLVLSPPATGAAENANGILSASEIAQLKLNADLVVLSACNTAEAPSGPGGSALEGLADAFFAAGAHSVIASHWEVPSAATEKLMVGVFADPNHADDLAQALRRSQLDLISQGATAHPFYWASFTLIGDGAAKGASAYKSASLEAGH